MQILILEPYLTGSHKRWAEDYAKYSKHEVHILGMDGHYWKWRMHGGALTLSRQFMESELNPDLILASDMLDLSGFLALTRSQSSNIPTSLYFHENQLVYPWSETDRDVVLNRDSHYSFINFSSAMVADQVYFNSKYHFESFFEALPRFLKGFPDHNELASIKELKSKSEVLDLGMDLKGLDQNRTERGKGVALLLWNHRWEYDKNPEDFFATLLELATEGMEFEVAVLGENFSEQPDIFLKAQEELGERIVHFGFAETRQDYEQWLWRSDILPVTSRQDFFGGSVVEAIYCNCFPILPDSLAYPQHIPADKRSKHLYETPHEFKALLKAAIQNVEQIRSSAYQEYVLKYDWGEMAPQYDDRFENILVGEP